jgi:hypothetical protein
MPYRLSVLAERDLTDVNAGRTTPARRLFARLRRKHGVPR